MVRVRTKVVWWMLSRSENVVFLHAWCVTVMASLVLFDELKLVIETALSCLLVYGLIMR